MNDLAQRAQRIADQAARRIETDIAREWWIVTRPGEPAFEVAMCPFATISEMRQRYPGATIQPRLT